MKDKGKEAGTRMKIPTWSPRLVMSVVLTVALTLVAGLLQGRLRNRWGASPAMVAAGERLGDIPNRFGGPRGDRWQSRSSEVLDDDSLEQLECTGYLVRRYENKQTGELVSVFLVVGPAGPIAVHTPEICYLSRNYRSRDQRQCVTVPGAEGREDLFWALTFQSKGLQGRSIRMYYGWSTGGNWSAPPDARWAFSGRPFLYKIQLSTNLPSGTDEKTSDACRRFLQDFVPVAKDYLVGPPAH
jgi:hypothetical protein